MTHAKLQQLEQQHAATAKRLVAAILQRWPEGTEVRVLLSYAQRNPSQGTVLHAYHDGRVAVRLKTTNRRGNFTIKHVHWTRITT